MNYYRFHIGDYASHTAHLSPMEDLAYRRMLDMYYRTQKPLPADTAQIARHIRLNDNIADIQLVLDEFFELGQDGWVSQRAEKEIASYKRMEDGGAKGAAKRWAKGGHSQGIATPSPPHANPNANQEPITNNQEPVTKGKPARKRATKTPLPENFVISDRVAEWAKQHGHTRLDEHLEVFKRKCIANGYTYASWDDAFMEAVRGDWAKLNQPVRPGFSNPADVARVTVPSKPDRDPVLVKLEQDAKQATRPPSHIIEKLAQLRQGT